MPCHETGEPRARALPARCLRLRYGFVRTQSAPRLPSQRTPPTRGGAARRSEAASAAAAFSAASLGTRPRRFAGSAGSASFCCGLPRTGLPRRTDDAARRSGYAASAGPLAKGSPPRPRSLPPPSHPKTPAPALRALAAGAAPPLALPRPWLLAKPLQVPRPHWPLQMPLALRQLATSSLLTSALPRPGRPQAPPLAELPRLQARLAGVHSHRRRRPGWLPPQALPPPPERPLSRAWPRLPPQARPPPQAQPPPQAAGAATAAGAAAGTASQARATTCGPSGTSTRRRSLCRQTRPSRVTRTVKSPSSALRPWITRDTAGASSIASIEPLKRQRRTSDPHTQCAHARTHAHTCEATPGVRDKYKFAFLHIYIYTFKMKPVISKKKRCGVSGNVCA